MNYDLLVLIPGHTLPAAVAATNPACPPPLHLLSLLLHLASTFACVRTTPLHLAPSLPSAAASTFLNALAHWPCGIVPSCCCCCCCWPGNLKTITKTSGGKGCNGARTVDCSPEAGQAAAAAQTQIRHTHAHTDIGNVSPPSTLPFFLLPSLSK